MIKLKCYKCLNSRDVPGNCHIQCVKPDATMTGSERGIKNGWFMYPLLFDPIWATSECHNFESNKTVVSQSVSSVGESK